MKPIELRSLYHPSSSNPQGKLEMWVVLLTPEEAEKIPIEDIHPPQPQRWQIRIIIWNVDGIPHKKGIFSGKDFFVSGKLGTQKPQVTDVNYSSHDGTGAFNWRFIFDFILPTKLENRLNIQLWDRDILTPDAFMAESTLNLTTLFRAAHKSGKNVNVARQWMELTFPNKQGLQGRVELEIEIVTNDYALAHPLGRGREGLPEPVRPVAWFNIPGKLKEFWAHSKFIIIVIIVIIVFIGILSLVLAFKK